MAFIRLKSNQGRVVSAEQGIVIWRILNGEIKGTKAQRLFVKRINKIYLNPATAPQSYLDKHPPMKIELPQKRELVTQARLPYAD